jgi:hypothetical protein
MTSEVVSPRKSESKPARELLPEQAAAAAMVAEAKARGLALTGPDGLLKLFTTTSRNYFSVRPPRLRCYFGMKSAGGLCARRLRTKWSQNVIWA